MRLEKSEIDALTCPPDKREVLFFDDALKGFGLRVAVSGLKTYVFQYRRGGHVRRMVLGRHGDLTPAQARKAAGIARGRVNEGRDPVAEHEAILAAEAKAREDAKREKVAHAFTLEKLVQEWEAKGLVSASESHAREAPAAIRRHLKKFLDRPTDTLEPAELQRAIDNVAKTSPAMARRTRDYARAMVNWARLRDLVATNPFASVRIETREVSRDRALSDAELGAAWRAACALDYPFGPLIRLLILTLQRRNEVAGMRWTELDEGFTTWTLPADRAKNRKAHIVPLPEAARAVLREVAAMPKYRGRRLIFTTTDKTPVSGFSNAHEQIVRLMAQEAAAAPGATVSAAQPWRLHDLRRTGVTTLARLKVAPHVADRLLNHVGGAIRGVAAVYQRHDFMEERVAAAKLWAEHVMAVAEDAPGGRPALPANVFRLHQRRGKI